MNFSSWSEVLLKDHINIKHGFAFKGEYFSEIETNDILVTPGNFAIGGGFKCEKFKYYSGSVPENYILNPGDIILTMTDLSKLGDTLGYPAIVPNHGKKRFLHNQRIGRVNFSSSDLDPLFLYWRLRNSDYQNYIVGCATGTTVKHTSPSTILNFRFILPSIKEQCAIASLLKSIEDKIELNNSINKITQEMAQAIFKRWFVDFEFPNENREPYKSSGGEMIESELGMIPKGWKVSILNDVINIIDNRGKTPPQEPNKTIYPIIDVKALSGYTRVIDYSDCTKYVSKETYNNWFRNGHPIHGDILISTVGSLAELKIFMGSKGCIAQNVVALRAKTISNLYLFELLKKNKNDLVSYDIGSVQPSIKVTHIIKHKILIPNFIVMNQFHQLMNEITNEVFVKHNENVLLTSMRDTILPKLMSGEIRIPLEEV